jgi:transglutaminase-like putative cysteine protease
MSPIHLIALCMVWVECATVTLMLHGWKLPLFLSVLAVVGAWGHWRFNPGWVPRRLMAIGLAAGFLVWWRLALADVTSSYVNIAFGNNMAYAFGLHFAAIQIWQMFIRHPYGLPVHFPLLGLGVMVFAGDSFPRQSWIGTVYFALAVVFMVLLCLYQYNLRPWRKGETRPPRRKYALMAAVLLLSVGLAAVTAAGLKWSERRMEQFLIGAIGLSPYETLGTSTTATLYGVQAVQRRDADRIALRLECESTPPYLRGHVFTEYRTPRWMEERESQTLAPAKISGLPGESILFPLAPADPASLCRMEIWPDITIESALFLPPGSAWLGVDAPRIRLDAGGIASTIGGTPGTPYRVYYDETAIPAQLVVPDPDPFLQLPERMADRLRSLAADLCGAEESPRIKAALLVQWLQKEHDYGTGFRAPDATDPLEYFLFDSAGQEAHCEFFAAAAALLLRAAQVPTRYVTGVAPWERGQLGDYWVVRNRDAHAWVEAFDPARGWFTVEATPAAGLPSAAPDDGSVLSELWYRMARVRARFFAALWSGDWQGMLALALEVGAAFLGGLFATWLIWFVLSFFGVAWFVQRRARLITRVAARIAPYRETGTLRAQHDLLRAMDRRLARQGLRRTPHETLHDFADRADAQLSRESGAGSWYRDYAAARYNPAEPAESLARLRASLHGIDEALRHRPK